MSFQSTDGRPTELIQAVGDDDVDRRLGRARVLSEDQLIDLRHDMCQVISDYQKSLQRFLESEGLAT